MLQEDDETTSVELHRLIVSEFGDNISAPTIRRHIRKNLKWAVIRTSVGPMISEANKIKRKAFAEMLLDNQDNFQNVIWTDESSVQLKQHCTMMTVKVGKERNIKPAAKCNVF